MSYSSGTFRGGPFTGCKFKVEKAHFSIPSKFGRRKKHTRSPPKEKRLGNFSGLEEELSRSVVDIKTYENQENHIYHRNLSSVAPIFFGKEKFCPGAGWCMLSFSQNSESVSSGVWCVLGFGGGFEIALEPSKL